MGLCGGLDLHSRSTYIGVLDKEFKRIFKKRAPNNLDLILQTLEPFAEQLKGLVVESTYNWYWLVDGLMDAGYDCVHLANSSVIIQYEILKYSDDILKTSFLVPGAGIESRLRDFACGLTGRLVQKRGILSRNNAKLKSQ